MSYRQKAPLGTGSVPKIIQSILKRIPTYSLTKSEDGRYMLLSNSKGQVVSQVEGTVGPTGPTGATPDISIGKVETLEPGAQATASITGSKENPKLNLGIPTSKEITINGSKADERGNIELGGRNYVNLASQKWANVSINASGEFFAVNTRICQKDANSAINLESNAKYVLSRYADEYLIDLEFANSENKIVYSTGWISNSSYPYRFTTAENYDHCFTIIKHVDDSNITVDELAVKPILSLEKGDISTDWTPAPEDKQDKLTGTAGQVVGFDENGNAVAQALVNTAEQLNMEIIPANSDLDTYTPSLYFRVYRTSSNADANTILHRPDGVSGSFALMCGRSSNGDSYFQIYIPYSDKTVSPSDPGAIYIRKKTVGVWRDWQELASSSDILKKQDKLKGTAGQIVGFDKNGEAIAIENQSVSFPISISNGGTGATEAENALRNLSNIATLALGQDANTSNAYSIAIGHGANTCATKGNDSTGSIAIGDYASATNITSIAVGSGASTVGSNSISVGTNANAYGALAIALGGDSQAGTSSTALGSKSKAYYMAIAVGYNVEANNNSIALGRNISATLARSVAIGDTVVSNGANSIAIGYKASANNSSTIAIGQNASSDGNQSIAIGFLAKSSSTNSIAIGCKANADTIYTTAVGNDSVASGTYSTAFGKGAEAKGDFSSAIGGGTANGRYSISLGYGSSANGNDSIAIGGRTKNDYAIALGSGANACSIYSMAIGPSSKVTGNNSAAFGYQAVSTLDDNIQLGNASSLSSITARVQITTDSDIRDKTDISLVDDGATEFLKKIKAVRYVLNHRELYIDEDNLSDEELEKKNKYGLCAYDKEAHAQGTKKGARIRVGVIAQELQEALKDVYGDTSYADLVNDNFFDYDPDTIPEGVENKLSVNYVGLIPFLIKAVQELSARIEQLEVKQ